MVPYLDARATTIRRVQQHPRSHEDTTMVTPDIGFVHSLVPRLESDHMRLSCKLNDLLGTCHTFLPIPSDWSMKWLASRDRVRFALPTDI